MRVGSLWKEYFKLETLYYLGSSGQLKSII